MKSLSSSPYYPEVNSLLPYNSPDVYEQCDNSDVKLQDDAPDVKAQKLILALKSSLNKSSLNKNNQKKTGLSLNNSPAQLSPTLFRNSTANSPQLPITIIHEDLYNTPPSQRANNSSNSHSSSHSSSTSTANSPQPHRIFLKTLPEKIDLNLILKNLKTNDHLDSEIKKLVKNKTTLVLKKETIIKIIKKIKTSNNPSNFYNKHKFGFPCSVIMVKKGPNMGLYLFTKNPPEGLVCEGNDAKVTCAIKLTNQKISVVAWRSLRAAHCGENETQINKKLSKHPEFFVAAEPIDYHSFWRIRGQFKIVSPKNVTYDKKGFPLEYCKCLIDLLLPSQSPPFSQALKWMTQITKALELLHSKGYVHRDLKLDNILISEENNIAKLGDFGLSQKVGEPIEKGPGTLEYCAPEIFNRELLSDINVEFAHDMFSLGILFMGMLDKEDTWMSLNIKDRPITNEEKTRILDNIEAEYLINNDGYSKESIDEVINLIYGCLETDPTTRISAKDFHNKLMNISPLTV